MTKRSARSNSSPSGSDARSPDKQTITRPKKVRKLKEHDRKLLESFAREKPVKRDTVDSGTSSQSKIPSPQPTILSSWKVEFSLQIGSFIAARKSMIVGYLTLVLIPTVIVLAIISLSSGADTVGARSLDRSLDHMLAVIAVMAIPMMVVSWAKGFYPKGSYGRLVSGLILASLLVVWLALLFVGSNLQKAFADFGTAFQIDRILVLACFIAVFIVERAISEFTDRRKAWRKSMGAEVKIAPINLDGGFLDFDPHIGKLQRGNSSALKAYVRFLVVPTVVLVVADWILEDSNLGTKDVIEASVGTMFDTVLLFGIVMVLIHFVRGFYPSGSLGRVIPGLMGVSVLSLFAWEILLGSGIEDAFGRNHFIIDMYAVLLTVLMYVMFMAVFELSELADNRRQWHKEIGIPVKPRVPEKHYHSIYDFSRRYASFIAGAKKGRKVVDKYAIWILLIILLEATAVSAYQYSGSQAISDFIRSILSDPRLGSHMDLNNMIYVLVLLAVANTAGLALGWSYREGSLARLIMSGIVAVFASLWAYVFWGSIADSIKLEYLATAFLIVMIALIAWRGLKALWALLGVYLRNRDTYLGWRSFMFMTEAGIAKPPLTPSVPAPTIASPGTLNG